LKKVKATGETQTRNIYGLTFEPIYPTFRQVPDLLDLNLNRKVVIVMFAWQAFEGRNVRRGQQVGRVYKVLHATGQIMVELPVNGESQQPNPRLATWNASECISLPKEGGGGGALKK